MSRLFYSWSDQQSSKLGAQLGAGSTLFLTLRLSPMPENTPQLANQRTQGPMSVFVDGLRPRSWPSCNVCLPRRHRRAPYAAVWPPARRADDNFLRSGCNGLASAPVALLLFAHGAGWAWGCVYFAVKVMMGQELRGCRQAWSGWHINVYLHRG